MPNKNTTTQKQKSRGIGASEFRQITWWVIKFQYNLEPIASLTNWLVFVIRKLIPYPEAYIFGMIINSIISAVAQKTSQLGDLSKYICLLFALYTFRSLLSIIGGFSNNVLRNRLLTKIQVKFYEKLNSLDIQTLEDPELNNVSKRAQDWLHAIGPYSDTVMSFLSNLTSVIVSCVLVTNLSPYFAPIVILISIPSILFDKKFRQMLYNFYYTNTEDNRKAAFSRYNLASTSSIEEIKVTNAFGFLHEKYAGFMAWYNSQTLKILKNWNLSGVFSSFLGNLLTIGSLIYFFKLILTGKLTVGGLTFWLRTIQKFQSDIESAFGSYNETTERALRLKDVYTIFHTEPEIKPGFKKLPLLTKGPTIEIKDMCFKYKNGKSIFENFNLRINSGEKVAIVGPNGAGKTTLVKIISKSYDIQTGTILINGENLRDIEISSWHNNLGVLAQNFNRYSQLTPRENIYIGNTKEPIDEIKVRLSAQAADAMEFIEEFPNKFDQTLDETFKGGVRPSSGQWQKLAIARFFYRNAPLVIFDEPTASIDAVSEYNIFNKIYEFFEGKTVIIISHRFSTVRNADRIVVLDHGKIVEEGSHEELMANGGHYQKAFLLQASGYTTSIV